MAITHIHPIKSTLGKAVRYCINDKIQEDNLKKDDIADCISYAVKKEKGEIIYYTLNATQNCSNPKDPIWSFKRNIQENRNKKRRENPRTKDGREILAWHLCQSFEGIVDPRIANNIGRKLAQEVFGNFPVTISTHTNTQNTHNHLMICAWDLYGKKWNNCNENYRKIREISDRLCDEYGLRVLEDTRKQKLVKYEDAEGKVHFYEPTKRKNDLIQKRQEGEISKDDVNSYRNTLAYVDMMEKDLTNKEIVKRDIDNLLTVANTYEHLLELLKDMGYTIKDKKKNGEWLAHIVFKSPTSEKGVRDYKISDDNFYTRENLTKYIEDLSIKRKEISTGANNKYFEKYIIGEVDIKELDEEYRIEKRGENNYVKVQRGEAERIIIADIKRNTSQLELYDTSVIKELIAKEKKKNQTHFEKTDLKNQNKESNKEKQEEILIRRIQESFDNLRFIEKKNIYSYKQINNIVKGLWGQYNKCLSSLNKMENIINNLGLVVRIPDKIIEVQNRIKGNQQRQNTEYMEFEYEADKKLLKRYQEVLEKYKIHNKADIEDFVNKINDINSKIEKLENMLLKYSNELEQYDRCINTLERIDKELNRDNMDIIQEYKAIKFVGEKLIKEKIEGREENNKKSKDKER